MSDSKTIDDGGPAFPVPNDANTNGQEGMSLRDWFAGQALAGVWAGRESDFHQVKYPGAIDIARAAYMVSDAMIAARKELPSGEVQTNIPL